MLSTLALDVERKVAAADITTHEGRLEFEHGLPRHAHDVRTIFGGGRYKHDSSWFEQTIEIRQAK